MSIADGQVVLQRSPDSGAVTMDFANSISRMGARAHPPAMQALCPPIRLRLAQAGALQLSCCGPHCFAWLVQYNLPARPPASPLQQGPSTWYLSTCVIDSDAPALRGW